MIMVFLESTEAIGVNDNCHKYMNCVRYHTHKLVEFKTMAVTMTTKAC